MVVKINNRLQVAQQRDTYYMLSLNTLLLDDGPCGGFYDCIEQSDILDGYTILRRRAMTVINLQILDTHPWQILSSEDSGGEWMEAFRIF